MRLVCERFTGMLSIQAAVLLLVAFTPSGCADDPAPDPGPDTALKLRMTATIEAGKEVEYCQFAELPDAWAVRDSVELTAGSHHVLVYQTPYTAIPTEKTNGTPVDTSGVFDCSDGATNGWSVTKLIAGSQNRDGAAFLSFPEGVALHVGGVVLINVHYINASDAPLDTEVEIAWDTIPAEQVTTEGDILFLYNPLISVPAGGAARARWQCPVYRDITISNLQSHMHSRGVGFAASADTGAPFYTTTAWEAVPVQRYESLTVRAGSKIDYHCDYRNMSGRSIYQGPRSSDEMCMLIGSYYPADPRTASCLDPAGTKPGGDWVGQGTATCQAMLGCLQTAASLPAITDCVLAAAPSVAHAASEVLRCYAGATDPAQCGPQIQACAAQ